MDGNAIVLDKAGQICTVVCLTCSYPYHCVHHVTSSKVCTNMCTMCHLCCGERKQKPPAPTIAGDSTHSVPVHVSGLRPHPFCLITGVYQPSPRQETVVTHGTYIVVHILQVQQEGALILAVAAGSPTEYPKPYTCPTMAIAALLDMPTKYTLDSAARKMREQLPFCVTADATGAHMYNIKPLRMNAQSIPRSTDNPLPGNTRKRRRKNIPKKIVAATVATSVGTTTASDAGPSALPNIDDVQ